MNTVASNADASPGRINYWRLWVGNAVLVSAGLLFWLANQYGTSEFLGVACLMALLPFIPILVLVGGAGSTVFVLTKVWIERRSVGVPTALTLLAGPGLALTLLLALAGVGKSPSHRLSYICLGNAPAATSHVQIAGYSTFLREEWLAVFQVRQTNFEAMVSGAQLAPADNFEFRKALKQSALAKSDLAHHFPVSGELPCYQRVFKEKEEHQRGTVYALFDPATSTAVVFREYRD